MKALRKIGILAAVAAAFTVGKQRLKSLTAFM